MRRSLAHRIVPAALAGLSLAVAAGAGAEALDPALATRVKSSIDVGLRHLRFQQRPDGSWDGSARATGLVLRALMESHRRYSAQDGPFIRDGLDFMARELDPADGSLEASALTLTVLAGSAQEAHRVAAGRAREALFAALEAEPECWRTALALEALAADGVAPDHPIRRQADRAAASCGDAVRSLALADTAELTNLDGYLLTSALAAEWREPGAEPAAGGAGWRARLAETLVARQRFEGHWLPMAGGEELGTVDTSAFALLALERLYDDGNWP